MASSTNDATRGAVRDGAPDPTPPEQAFDVIHETRGDRAADALPHTRFSSAVDRFQLALGGALSWIWLLLLFVIVLNVVLRYAFGEGRIELEELQWHLFAVGFLTALALAVTTDDHVRVDVIHERLPPRWRAWIELYGSLLLLGPFIALILIHSVPFVVNAWQASEVSQAPGGLPLRWLIKAALPVSFLLLAAAVLARLTRVSSLLFGVPESIPESVPESVSASAPAALPPGADTSASAPPLPAASPGNR